MDRENPATAMPFVRAAFDRLKDLLRDGRMTQACAMMFGTCRSWGAELKDLYLHANEISLAEQDFLTQFFITRFRGMPQSAELFDAPPEAVFLMAYTAFPYLDALLEELTLGDHAGFDEDGNWLVRRLMAGELEHEHALLRAIHGENSWQFDLMPLFDSKSLAMQDFIQREFSGDFRAFLWRYVAEHDLPFDMTQAWLPVKT